MGWVFQTKADIKKHVLAALDYQFGNLDETYKDVRETFEMVFLFQTRHSCGTENTYKCVHSQLITISTQTQLSF
jgi:hypothetical protein